MINKDKITISLSTDLLSQIDKKIDKLNFKNRSNVIENLLREWLKLKNDISRVILAHEKKWNSWDYPLHIPKVLIKIDWKTLLEKHLENLKKAKIKQVIISVWNEKEQIKAFIKNKDYWLSITFIEVDEQSFSWFVLSKAKQIIDTEKVLVILWDNYFSNLNLLDFIYYHNTNFSDLTILTYMLDSWKWYGNIKLEWNNIIWFVEKPEKKEDISFVINAWVYLLKRDSIEEINANIKLERDFFPRFIEKKNVKSFFYNHKYFHIQDNETLNLFYK